MLSADLGLREFISKQHPEFPIRSLAILGEGLENIAAEVNGDIIFRFAKNPSGRKAIQKEIQLLELLTGVGSVEIPVPIAELSGNNHYAYKKIQGHPLILVLDQMADEELSSICHVLGNFLSELHSISPEHLKGLVPVDAEPFKELIHEARDTFNSVKDIVPEAVHASVQEFLDSPLPKKPVKYTFIHNDLGIEHLIVNSGKGNRLGVIDWSDAAIGDPAVDFSRIYRDLGAERLKKVFGQYRFHSESVEEISKRVEFYARCTIFEEFAFGRAPGHEIYLARANEALLRLFPGTGQSTGV